MALSLAYDPVLSRVQISGTGLIDAMTVRAERSTDQVTWSTVRGGTAMAPAGGVISLDDYEFAPDVANFYRLRGPAAFEDYQRSASNGWATLLSGQVTTTNGGAVSDYSVNGTKGVLSLGSVGVFRHVLADVGATDQRIRTTVSLNTGTVTGANLTAWLLGRVTDINNYYTAQLMWQTDDTVRLVLLKRVAGAVTGLSSTVTIVTGFGAGQEVTVELDVAGSTIRAKAWAPASQAEPVDYQLSVTDTALAAGNQFGHAARLESGNTNALPVQVQWDNTVVSVPEATISTANTTPVLDGVWLKSLARPFLNRQVTVRGFSPMSRASRGGVFPIVGRSVPVAVTELHGSKRWTLDLNTYSDDEADALDLLVSTGEVQFVHVPTTGLLAKTPGGYVALGDTAEEVLPTLDLNNRVFSLPLTRVAAPGADVVPAIGTCQTVINNYPTCADVLVAHPTCADLLNLIGSPADVIVP